MKPAQAHQARQFDLFDTGSQAGVAQAIRQADAELPRLAREMVEVMGEAATLALVAAAGGTVIMVPGWPLKRASSRFDSLAAIVGHPAAVAFAERWGNIEVSVPMCKAALIKARDRRIRAALDAGQQPHELARAEHLTERHIWRIAKRAG